jgi:hypothetical protein
LCHWIRTYAVFRAFIAGIIWTWVDAILSWIITALVLAIAAVNSIKEVVERCAFDEITNLIECNLR